MEKEKLIIKHNNLAWDSYAAANVQWSKPVSKEVIDAAKKGDWEIHVTKKPLSKDWLPSCIKDKKILCLASAGGQQAPVLSAAGADVTVYDISEGQLGKDEYVAKRDGLSLKTIKGDMRDLSIFQDNTFDYIISPISNLYIPDLDTLWKECNRVLKKNGILITSFYNPIIFIFNKDKELQEQGLLKPKYKLPYSEIDSLNKDEYNEKIEKGEAFVFGHTLTEQMGKQIEAGFSIVGFYEDEHPSPRFLIEKYTDTMIATKAKKM